MTMYCSLCPHKSRTPTHNSEFLCVCQPLTLYLFDFIDFEEFREDISCLPLLSEGPQQMTNLTKLTPLDIGLSFTGDLYNGCSSASWCCISNILLGKPWQLYKLFNIEREKMSSQAKTLLSGNKYKLNCELTVHHIKII